MPKSTNILALHKKKLIMLKPALNEVIDHIRNRTYMGGVERDQLRVKATGEVFTPTELVREMLEQIPIEQFQDPNKTFLDNSCGDGQFLGEVLIRKMENGSTFEQALQTIYGVDLMQDNVSLCRERLLCGQKHLQHVVEKNIVCHDGMTYDYSFNGTDQNQDELTWDRLFSFESALA
jgi:type I restriction-modification system DNA methylase subunit